MGKNQNSYAVARINERHGDGTEKIKGERKTVRREGGKEVKIRQE
jgi:hypothetical protein